MSLNTRADSGAAVTFAEDPQPRRQFDACWAIEFPAPARELSSRGFPMTTVGNEIIDQLGMEELAAYMRLRMWHETGQESSVQRLADELWAGNRYKALLWVHELKACGLVVVPGTHEREMRARLEAAATTGGDAPRVAKPQSKPEFLSGSWAGTWPLDEADDLPPLNTPVVYYQYDRQDILAYVGSAKDFRKRMGDHTKSFRSGLWVRWEARECPSRPDAFTLETGEINRLFPYQNMPGYDAQADYLRALSGKPRPKPRRRRRAAGGAA